MWRFVGSTTHDAPRECQYSGISMSFPVFKPSVTSERVDRMARHARYTRQRKPGQWPVQRTGGARYPRVNSNGSTSTVASTRTRRKSPPSLGSHSTDLTRRPRAHRPHGPPSVSCAIAARVQRRPSGVCPAPGRRCAADLPGVQPGFQIDASGSRQAHAARTRT